MAKAKADNKGRRVRSERSAGVILFRLDENEADGRLFLLLDHGRHWDFPKGHVEEEEADLDAALRELAEETGIGEARVIGGFLKTIVYLYQHPKKGLVRKTVVFYLAATDRKKVTLSDEHVRYAWLPLEEAMQRLTYPTAKEAFAAAVEFMGKQRGFPAH
jgi:bis(5'-nucleosidyl)-tetraphosphatase